jgi:acyl-CoA hydrolase
MSVSTKSPSESLTEMNQIVLPPHTNALGTAFGGTVIAWIDICAAMAAQRHARSSVVTASMEAVDFIAPIRLGDLVNLTASVDSVGRSSMIVGVRVEAEDLTTGERSHAANAHVTFVALNGDGVSQEVPRLNIQTAEERGRHEAAERIKARRGL